MLQINAHCTPYAILSFITGIGLKPFESVSGFPRGKYRRLSPPLSRICLYIPNLVTPGLVLDWLRLPNCIGVTAIMTKFCRPAPLALILHLHSGFSFHLLSTQHSIAVSYRRNNWSLLSVNLTSKLYFLFLDFGATASGHGTKWHCQWQFVMATI